MSNANGRFFLSHRIDQTSSAINNKRFPILLLQSFITDEFIDSTREETKIALMMIDLFVSFQAYLMKFLTKFVGECNEKDLPILKDQWRNLMIERLEEKLERPYQIEVERMNSLSCKQFFFSF